MSSEKIAKRISEGRIYDLNAYINNVRIAILT